jgi:hypothetical protein
MKVDSERVWVEQNKKGYEGLFHYSDAQPVRVTISRDTYDFQSYGRAELFDGYKWNVVASIPYPKLKINTYPAYGQGWTDENIARAWFAPDRDELLRLVLIILG